VGESRRVFENALTTSTAEERKTARMYRRASELMTGETKEVYIEDPTDKRKNRISSPKIGWDYAMPVAKKWLEENQESLDLILEAAQRESCAFLDLAGTTYDQSLGVFKPWKMSDLLLFSARKLESENKLDEALERYIATFRLGRHVAQRGRALSQWNYGQSIQYQTFNWIRLWAGHPQQTRQLLKQAIDQIRTETNAYPSQAEAITIQNGVLRRTFIEEPNILLAHFSSSSEPQKEIFLAMLLRFCPWERTRSVQLLELFTIDELNYFRNFQARLDRRGSDMVRWGLSNSSFFISQRRLPPWNLFASTPLLSPFLPSHQSSRGLNLIGSKTRREATLLTLGLIAYRKEHGELPERLDQLVGEYFDELPLDPWSGREFGYEPKGFPTQVAFSNHVAEPGQPLLWSSSLSGAKVI
jgi:hypothetical protein